MGRKSRRRSRRRRTRKRRGSGVAEKTQAALSRKHRMQDLAKRQANYQKALKESRDMSLQAKRDAFKTRSVGSRNVLAGGAAKGTLEYFLRLVKPSAEGNEGLMSEKERTEAYRQWHEYTREEYLRRRKARSGKSLVAGRRRKSRKRRRTRRRRRRR